MRLALVDDDYCIHQQFVEALMDQTVDLFFEGQSFLKTLETVSYDLIFLDIYLPDTTGFSLGRLVRNSSFNAFCPIVYLSARTDAALKLFSTQPYDFIIKPIESNQIKTLVETIRFGASFESIEFKQGRELLRVNLKDIIYFESRCRLLFIHTRRETYRTYHKMSDFSLDYPFFRIHQSYLVNLDYVLEFSHNKVVLWDGTQLNVSRKYQELLKNLLLKNLRSLQ